MNEKIESLGGGLFGLILAAVIASWQTVIVVGILYGILLFANLITGILYAKQTGTYDKNIAERAVYKKLGMTIGILALFLVDFIIMGLARSAGIIYTLPVFGCVLAGYASVHELTSMLQNLKKLGNKVPAAIEDAAKKAEDALNQGNLPGLADILKGKKEGV
jgi:phage-related holin